MRARFRSVSIFFLRFECKISRLENLTQLRLPGRRGCPNFQTSLRQVRRISGGSGSMRGLGSWPLAAFLWRKSIFSPMRFEAQLLHLKWLTCSCRKDRPEPMPTTISTLTLSNRSRPRCSPPERYESLCHDVKRSIGSLGICIRLSGASWSGYPRDIPQTTDSEGLSFN